jgi:hypothetical protein
MAIQDALCNKIKSDFDSISGPLFGDDPITSKSKSIQDKINSIKTKISNMVLSPLKDITLGINSINTNLSDMIPGTGEMEEMLDLMERCDYFNSDATDTVGLIAKASGVLSGMQSDLVKSMADISLGLESEIPEFEVANLMDTISVEFKSGGEGGGISEDMSALDKIIECITSICGPTYISEASDMIDKVNDIYEKMNMIDDPTDSNFGKLDISSIGASAGLSPNQISNSITSITDTLTTNKNSIADSVTNGTSELIGLLL